MSPVRVYAATPLHADGVTPKTAEIGNEHVPPPTKTIDLSSPYDSLAPPPRPGAHAELKPTPTAGLSLGPFQQQPMSFPQPTPSPGAGVSPGPPAPQPGAFPFPQSTPLHSAGHSPGPPAPQPGARPLFSAAYTSQSTDQWQEHTQFYVPPPSEYNSRRSSQFSAVSPPPLNHTRSQSTQINGPSPFASWLDAPPMGSTGPHARAHSIAFPPSSQFPSDAGPQFRSGLHSRTHSREHPPGYVQNPYAADGTPSDRVRFAEAARRASEAEGFMGNVKEFMQGASKTWGRLEEDVWKWAKGN